MSEVEWGDAAEGWGMVGGCVFEGDFTKQAGKAVSAGRVVI